MINRRIITIPPRFLREIEFNWDIDWRGQAPRARLNGTSEDVLSAFPMWVGSPVISLRREQILTWRAIRASAQGRANLYRVRMCDPLGRSGASSDLDGIPFSTEEPFSNGLGFEYRPFCRAVGAVTRGSETMVLAGDAPKVGQMISHDDWPYVVTSVLTQGDGTHLVGFQMPLYANIPDDDPVFLDGRGLFEASDSDMGAVPYSATSHTRARLSFRQYITR